MRRPPSSSIAQPLHTDDDGSEEDRRRTAEEEEVVRLPPVSFIKGHQRSEGRRRDQVSSQDRYNSFMAKYKSHLTSSRSFSSPA